MSKIELFKLWGSILIDNEQAMKSLSSTEKKFEAVGKKLESFGKGMMTKVTLPLMAVGAGVLKVGSNFETAMSQVEAMSGATGEQMERLEKAARDAGAATSKSAKDAADGLTYMALAGWDVESSISGLMPVLRLSEAGNIDLARASSLVTDSMSAMGIEVQDLEGYLDIVAQTARSSNTDIDQMAEAYLGVGGTLRGLDIPLNESALALGMMANAGIKGSEAGKGLNAVLLNMTAPTGRAEKALKELGLTAFDNQGEFKGLENVLFELKGKTENMTTEQENMYLSMIGGKEHIKTLNALMNGLDDSYVDLKGNIGQADGALNDIALTMQDNLAGRMNILKSSLEEVSLQLYEHLIPYFEKFIGWVQEGVNWFSELDPVMQENIVKFALIAAAIGPIILIGGKLVSGIGMIIGLGKSLIAVIGFLVSPIGLVVVAITAAIAIGVLLYKNWDTVKEKAIELGNKIAETWENIKTKTVEAWDGIKTKITDTVTTLATDAVQWGKDMVTGLWNGITGMADWIGEKVSGFASGIANKFKSFFGIESPSTLMEEYGKNLDEGLAIGIEVNEDIPLDAIKTLADKMANAAKAAVERTNAIIAQAVTDVSRARAEVAWQDAQSEMAEKEGRKYLGDDHYDNYDGNRVTVDEKGLFNNTKVGARKIILDTLIEYEKFVASGQKGGKGTYADGWENSEKGQFWTGMAGKYEITDAEMEAMKNVAKGQVTQNITINSPKALSPSETAREMKNASRELAMGV